MIQDKIKKSIPLKKLTTFKVGGLATYYVEVTDREELIKAIEFAREKSLEVFVLGGGSNILLSDLGFRGLVIKYTAKRIAFEDKKRYSLVIADAGAAWDDLVAKTVNKKLQGIECLSGIPGTVGAAPIQNISAYGQELRDVFVSLTAYDLTKGKYVVLTKDKCEFGYRDSIFKKPNSKGRYVIVDIKIKLYKDKPPQLLYESLKSFFKKKKIENSSLSQVRKAVLQLRNQKLDSPKELGNAGSFFKNPIISEKKFKSIKKDYSRMPYQKINSQKIKLFSGWLIETAGWKGKKYKNAQVSKKNALVILNPDGKASAKDIKNLADKISADINKKFKLKLELEVQYIGF